MLEANSLYCVVSVRVSASWLQFIFSLFLWCCCCISIFFACSCCHIHVSFHSYIYDGTHSPDRNNLFSFFIIEIIFNCKIVSSYFGLLFRCLCISLFRLLSRGNSSQCLLFSFHLSPSVMKIYTAGLRTCAEHKKKQKAQIVSISKYVSAHLRLPELKMLYKNYTHLDTRKRSLCSMVGHSLDTPCLFLFSHFSQIEKSEE